MTPDELSALIRSRRSSLLIDAHREVPRDIVEHLLELLTWAPNHKRTWPWRLAVLTGESRRALGEAIADVMAAQGDDAPKVAKTRTKYLRSPIVIAAGAAPGDSPERTAENRYAVAAGIQNLLLAAHAHGLAALWVRRCAARTRRSTTCATSNPTPRCSASSISDGRPVSWRHRFARRPP